MVRRAAELERTAVPRPRSGHGAVHPLRIDLPCAGASVRKRKTANEAQALHRIRQDRLTSNSSSTDALKHRRHTRITRQPKGNDHEQRRQHPLQLRRFGPAHSRMGSHMGRLPAGAGQLRQLPRALRERDAAANRPHHRRRTPHPDTCEQRVRNRTADHRRRPCRHHGHRRRSPARKRSRGDLQRPVNRHRAGGRADPQ